MKSGQQSTIRQHAKSFVKHRFSFRKTKPQEATVQQDASEFQEYSATTSAQASIGQSKVLTPEVQASLDLKDLWQAAYDQLDEAQKRILSTVKVSIKTNSNGTPQATDVIDAVIELTKERYEEYQTRGQKIRRSEGADINLRKVSEKIINAALSFKDIITTLAAFDPTQHASSAWAIVSLGLTVRQ